MSTAESPKQRKSFTDRERQRLRLYHKSYPSLTPHQLASWFESEFNRRVSNSSVYDILSAKYAYLDTAEATDAVRRKKGPQCPELEEELYRWWGEVQPRDVTGKELRKKASEIWQTLPPCRREKAPSFSDGWLSSWRVRYGLTQYTRPTEVKQSTSREERMETAHSVPAFSSLCHPQRIYSPEPSNWTTSSSSSPLTFAIEQMHHGVPLNFLYPTPQTSCNPQFGWSVPSTTHCCSPLNLSNWSRLDSKTHDLQVERTLTEKPHKDNRFEPTASHHAINTSSKACAAHSGVYSPIDLPDEVTWNGIRELFLKCNSGTTRNLLTTNAVVLDVLDPFLSSLDFNPPDCSKAIHWQQRQAKKAIGLLYAAEEFELRHAKDGLQQVFYEDWFLDFIDIRALQSTSPNSGPIEEAPSSKCNFSGDPVIKPQRFLRYKTSSFSPIARNGTVDLWTRSSTNHNTAGDKYAIEQFQATAVITPPTGIHSVPQIIVQLATRTTKLKSTISRPIISFRPIIPENSVIFNTAEFGTSSDLQMMLSKRENSLYDCDPAGRSLINYALDGRNVSTLKYLLMTVKDIDVYEPDSTGLPSSLVGMIMGFDGRACHYERDRRLTCLKLMLDAGADPSLNYYPSLEESTFELELQYGTVAALKALLDLGHPCVHPNAAFSISFNSEYEQTPLLSLAENFHLLFDQSLDMCEKVFLLLDRGADIAARDNDGKTCLHLVLLLDADMEKNEFGAYQEDEFKDILMCMVTAGADLFACDMYGRTVSQTAVEYGNEELWREVLAKSGYDPDQVFNLEDHFRCRRFQEQPGMAVFPSVALKLLSTKLSFADYGSCRKSLDCVRRVYSREEVDFWTKQKECDDFWETYVEASDSEDDEWASVNDDEYNDTARLYGDGVTTSCYPELLHNGLPWRTTFS